MKLHRLYGGFALAILAAFEALFETVRASCAALDRLFAPLDTAKLYVELEQSRQAAPLWTRAKADAGPYGTDLARRFVTMLRGIGSGTCATV